MLISKKIPIQSDLDVVIARMQTRLLARQIGFNSVDQARISLAASELARNLARIENKQGQIIISGTNIEGHVGLEVVSISPNGISITTPATKLTPAAQKRFSSIIALVDEYLIENNDHQGTRITLMKWLN